MEVSSSNTLPDHETLQYDQQGNKRMLPATRDHTLSVSDIDSFLADTVPAVLLSSPSCSSVMSETSAEVGALLSHHPPHSLGEEVEHSEHQSNDENSDIITEQAEKKTPDNYFVPISDGPAMESRSLRGVKTRGRRLSRRDRRTATPYIVVPHPEPSLPSQDVTDMSGNDSRSTVGLDEMLPKVCSDQKTWTEALSLKKHPACCGDKFGSGDAQLLGFCLGLQHS